MSMIVDIYNRVSQLTKSGTSGYVDQDEFNGIINSAQYTLADMLIDKVGVNNKANDAVNWIKVRSDIATDSSGLMAIPTNYFRLDIISLLQSGNEFDMSEIQRNQIPSIKNDSIVMPNLATGDAYYYYENNAIYTLPEVAMTVRFRYYKTPTAASITLTPSETGGNDYLTPTVDTELGWPYSVFNLLTYIVLFDYGFEMKEEAIMEFAKFGITWANVKNETVDAEK